MRLTKTFFSLSLLLVPALASAQTVAQDPTVRVGKLDNGLTYYIRHNAKDPKIADFYIAQRVGSILEEPNQRGLAHFLEHMAFNGTKHFPGDKHGLGIVPWCETVGIKFGANLNAYTSVDQTVYNISSAPTVREGVVDSCLLILHDWSNSLLLKDKEIDKERGVIHEEWRTRRAGMAVQRLMERVMPTVYKGTKYEDCLPIGSMDVVDHFKYKALRDYYKKWYRPDLQAIIVVGDIDVDQMEQKIKRLFSSIPKAKNPAKRIYYPVPDNDRMIVAVEKDAEQPIVLAKLYMKRDATPDNEKDQVAYQRDGYMEWLVKYMLNQRIIALQHQPVPPFISASAGSGQFFVSRTKDAFDIQVGCKQDDINGSLSAVLAETERARQHGFTEAELQRAKAKYLKSAERAAAEYNTRKNSYFVGKCVRNFLASEPMLTAAEDLRLAQQFGQSVTLQEVNKAVKDIINDKNQVLTIYAPDKEGVKIPTEAQLESIVLAAQAKQYEPYEEEVYDRKLMEQMPKAGQVVSEKAYPRHGVKQLTLSNGVNVYIKPTDYSADQVIFKMFAKGGTSNLPDTDVPNFSFVTATATESGVGKHDVLTLRKLLADKLVKVTPVIDNETQAINASCAANDMETMLQMVNLYFTEPRFDKTAFESLMERRRSLYKNREASPTVTYNDSVSSVLYGNSPRTAPMKLATLDKVSFDRLPVIYKQLFSNAADFDVLIIGNVNVDSIKPLLCQYIASLPSTGKRTSHIANTYPAIRGGNETHLFVKKQATPSAMVNVFYTADLPVTAANDLKLDVLKRVLQIAYTDSVREEKGGTYGVSVNFDLDRYSAPTAMLKISFRCDPNRYGELMPVVYNQLKSIAQKGPDATSLSKTKKYLVKQLGQNELTNDYWRYVLYSELYAGVDYHTGYTKMVNSITAADIKALATELLRQNHRLEITMKSE